MKTIIIAEAGVNHDGQLERALNLVEIAKDSGADFVKFQTFNAEKLLTPDALKADYQRITTDQAESQYQMIKSLELSYEDHVKIQSRCNDLGIGFLSTPFDIDSLNMLLEFNIPYIKIPSGEVTNLPYLEYVGGKGKNVIVSTGMCTLEEIRSCLSVLQCSGTSLDKVIVLHCNTEYPTPISDVNLRAMLSIREAFNVRVGYSDHTLGIEVPIAAVALGANVIEKHFTISRNLSGPDHRASLEPSELKSMVHAIRNIEASMGDGIKRPSKSEYKNLNIARRSIVAARAIRRGEPFSSANLATKRPGTGISPMRLNEVLGVVASRDFRKDELIEL